MLRALNHRLNSKIRNLKLFLADQLISPFSKHIDLNEAQAHLVLRLDGKVGDAVTSTGFLRQIKKSFPHQKLILIINGSQKDIFKNLNFIDEIIVINKSIFQLFKEVNRLRSIKFGYIINTSHILKPNVIFFAGLLKAFQKITFSNFHIKTFSKHVDIDFTKDHITDRYFKTLKMLRVFDADLSYIIELDKQILAEAQQSIKKLGAKKIVALNSFSGARDRNLGQSKTVEIVKKLTEDPDVYVLSLAGQNDEQALRQWMTEYSHPRWIYFSEYKTLQQNCALLSSCNFLITPDTAWVHIANALKIKQLAIFREDTNPQELNAVIWAPIGNQSKVIIAPHHLIKGSRIDNVDIEQLMFEVRKMI